MSRASVSCPMSVSRGSHHTSHVTHHMSWVYEHFRIIVKPQPPCPNQSPNQVSRKYLRVWVGVNGFQVPRQSVSFRNYMGVKELSMHISQGLTLSTASLVSGSSIIVLPSKYKWRIPSYEASVHTGGCNLFIINTSCVQYPTIVKMLPACLRCQASN